MLFIEQSCIPWHLTQKSVSAKILDPSKEELDEWLSDGEFVVSHNMAALLMLRYDVLVPLPKKPFKFERGLEFVSVYCGSGEESGVLFFLKFTLE